MGLKPHCTTPKKIWCLVGTFPGEKRINKILMRLIALDNLKKTIPLTDKDQKLALLQAPFTGTTLFGGELGKLQEANTKQASAFTVFPTPTEPPVSYSSRPYVGQGKSYNFSDRRGGYSQKSGGRGREWAGPLQPPLSLDSLKKTRQP